MTPKQAYDHISKRAQRLLRYHDGLVNTRRRRMRKDWKSSFCTFMRWPQAHKIDRVDSKDAVVILRDHSGISSSDFASVALDDLLRSSLALGVSGLDRYLHERVVKKIVMCLRTRSPSNAQERLTIPALLASRLTDAWAKSSRGGRRVRPANQLRISLQEALHRRAFQSWRDMEEAFELISIPGLSGKLQAAYGLADIKPMKAQFTTLVQRRHHIVHEGDLVRHARGGRCRVQTIRRRYVADSLAFIDRLVEELDKIT